MNYFLDHGAKEPVVEWGSVLADFGRPWLGLEASLYRPMLNVSYAIDLAIGGGEPLPLHATNLLLHMGTSFFAAILCALYCPARPALAALLGGCFVAVSPIACETVAWISARNSGLETFFRMASLAAFALWLRRSRRAPWILLSGLAAACALCTYEAAIMLPVSMLALDLLDRPDRPLAERVRLHLPLLPLWLGYFCLRLILFGGFIGSGTGHALSESSLAGEALAKFALLTVPVPLDQAGSSAFWWVTAASLTLLWATAASIGLLRKPVLLLASLIWIGLHFAPTYMIETHGLGGGRLVYPALPVICLCACALFFGAGHTIIRLPAIAFAAAIICSVPVTRSQLGHFEMAWAELATAREELDQIGARSSLEQPLALGTLPSPMPGHGLPPLNPNVYFPLAGRPYASDDYPTLGIGYISTPVPGSQELLNDASAARALWHQGASLVYWTNGQFLVRRKASTDPLPPLENREPEHWAFQGAPVRVFDVEKIEIRVEGDSAGGTLSCLPSSYVPANLLSLPFGEGQRQDNSTLFTIDLTHHKGLLALAVVDIRLTGFKVELLGDGRTTRVQAMHKLPELTLRERLGGTPLSLTEFEERLRAPAPLDPNMPMRMILMGPQAAMACPIDSDGRVTLSEPIKTVIKGVDMAARQKNYYFFFEQLAPHAGAPAARSSMDRFTLR